MATAGTVIVGAGQGGYQVAASLRESGYAEPVYLIGDEVEPPYQRPPLSKGYLLGEMSAERLWLRSRDYYVKHQIEPITGTRVTGIDRAAKRVSLSSGTSIAYDNLVLATGARNRRLPLPGAELDGVMYLRTIAEANAIQQYFGNAQTIVVIGAGFIGLELAAVASKLGKQVAVVEALSRVMSRAVSPIISQFYAASHAQWGVELLFDARVSALEGANGKVDAMVLADGRRLPADLVLVGIGIEPAAELGAQAGLKICNGIATDATLVTSDRSISAVGDCASFPDPNGAIVRLESVQNAVDQGRCVARRIAGETAAYSAVPWFWSDQRDLKLQMVGLTAACERTVVRGSVEKGAFSVFCFRNDRLVGIESVNRGADHVFGRRLIGAGETITPDEAGDMSFDLKARLSRVASAA